MKRVKIYKCKQDLFKNHFKFYKGDITIGVYTERYNGTTETIKVFNKGKQDWCQFIGKHFYSFKLSGTPISEYFEELDSFYVKNKKELNLVKNYSYDELKDYIAQQEGKKIIQRISDIEHLNTKGKIVTIVSPIRFKETYTQIATDIAVRFGGIVLLPVDTKDGSDKELIREEIFDELMSLHRRKIDMADIVLVVIVDSYFGHGTYEEIGYAALQNKEVLILDLKSEGEI